MRQEKSASTSPGIFQFQRACNLANASVKTYLQNSADILWRTRTQVQNTFVSSMLGGKSGFPNYPTSTLKHDVVEVDHRLSSRDMYGKCDVNLFPFKSTAASTDQNKHSSSPTQDSHNRELLHYPSEVVSQIDRQLGFATVITNSKVTGIDGPSIASRRDYMWRSPAEELGLSPVEESVARGEGEIDTDINTALDTLKKFKLRGKAQSTILKERTPQVQRTICRKPLSEFENLKDSIGNRVPADSWKDQLLPSLGSDLRYCGESKGKNRWFKDKKCGAENAEIPDFPDYLNVLQQLCLQTMKLPVSKKTPEPKKQGRQNVTVKGGWVPLDIEGEVAPADVAVVRQTRTRAVLQKLNCSKSLPQPASHKMKDVKEVAIQTTVQESAALPTKATTRTEMQKVSDERTPPKNLPHYISSVASEVSLSDVEDATPARDAYASPSSPSADRITPRGSRDEKEDLCAERTTSAGIDHAGSTAPVELEMADSASMRFLDHCVNVSMGLPNPYAPPQLGNVEGLDSVDLYSQIAQIFNASVLSPSIDIENSFKGEPTVTKMPNLRQESENDADLVGETSSTVEMAHLFASDFSEFLENAAFDNFSQTPAPDAQTAETYIDVWQDVAESAAWHEQMNRYINLQQQWNAYHQQMYQHSVADQARELECDKSEARRQEDFVNFLQNKSRKVVREEFKRFAQTQYLLKTRGGSRMYSGRAAIGNSRGGRRIWKIFDRFSRTPAERKRQLGFKNLPEREDCFTHTDIAANVRCSRGSGGFVRGGRRSHFCVLRHAEYEKNKEAINRTKPFSTDIDSEHLSVMREKVQPSIKQGKLKLLKNCSLDKFPTHAEGDSNSEWPRFTFTQSEDERASAATSGPTRGMLQIKAKNCPKPRNRTYASKAVGDTKELSGLCTAGTASHQEDAEPGSVGECLENTCSRKRPHCFVGLLSVPRFKTGSALEHVKITKGEEIYLRQRLVTCASEGHGKSVSEDEFDGTLQSRTMLRARSEKCLIQPASAMGEVGTERNAGEAAESCYGRTLLERYTEHKAIERGSDTQSVTRHWQDAKPECKVNGTMRNLTVALLHQVEKARTAKLPELSQRINGVQDRVTFATKTGVRQDTMHKHSRCRAAAHSSEVEPKTMSTTLPRNDGALETAELIMLSQGCNPLDKSFPAQVNGCTHDQSVEGPGTSDCIDGSSIFNEYRERRARNDICHVSSTSACILPKNPRGISRRDMSDSSHEMPAYSGAHLTKKPCFPWDDEIIPTCRSREKATSECIIPSEVQEIDAGGNHVHESYFTGFLQHGEETAPFEDGNSSMKQPQVVCQPFLKRRSGYGGGHMPISGSNTRDVSGKVKSENSKKKISRDEVYLKELSKVHEDVDTQRASKSRKVFQVSDNFLDFFQLAKHVLDSANTSAQILRTTSPVRPA